MLRGPLCSNSFFLFCGGGKEKVDIFLALRDQSHALASLTRLPNSSKRKTKKKKAWEKLWPKAAISASFQLVPGPFRLSSVPNLEYDAPFKNVSGPR